MLELKLIHIGKRIPDTLFTTIDIKAWISNYIQIVFYGT